MKLTASLYELIVDFCPNLFVFRPFSAQIGPFLDIVRRYAILKSPHGSIDSLSVDLASSTRQCLLSHWPDFIFFRGLLIQVPDV